MRAVSILASLPIASFMDSESTIRERQVVEGHRRKFLEEDKSANLRCHEVPD